MMTPETRRILVSFACACHDAAEILDDLAHDAPDAATGRALLGDAHAHSRAAQAIERLLAGGAR